MQGDSLTWLPTGSLSFSLVVFRNSQFIVGCWQEASISNHMGLSKELLKCPKDVLSCQVSDLREGKEETMMPFVT